MTARCWPFGLAMLVLAIAALPARVAGATTPLFANDDEVEITLSLPLHTLLRQRLRGPGVDGTVIVTSSAAVQQRLDVEVTTRGRQRLATCAFPPLRLDFRRSQVPDTLFAGQNRLKLVTRCRDTRRSEEYLELEYFVYRAYERIGAAAFRVRPSRISYVDVERENDVSVAPAFFIEPIAAVASRLGSRAAKVPSLRLEQIEPRALTRLALFQFMIGNTDWAATRPSAGDDECCHNADVLELTEDPGTFVLVPYDFDHAGIVDAEYAMPDERLGISSVRERLYRGFCIGNGHLAEAIEQLNAARGEIEGLLEHGRLTPHARTAAMRYLARSYEIVNDERERQRQIVDRCLGAPP